jgi:hypothetical protein
MEQRGYHFQVIDNYDRNSQIDRKMPYQFNVALRAIGRTAQANDWKNGSCHIMSFHKFSLFGLIKHAGVH